MSGLLPAAVYGLEVPCGDVMIPARPDFPAAFRITMAALDPTAEPEFTGNIQHGALPRATLKLIRQPYDPEESDEDSEDEDELEAILNGAGDDEDDDSEEDEEDEKTNAGPSDPAKSKMAREAAAIASLKKALAEEDDEDDDDMAIDGPKRKGKGKATDLDSEDDSDIDSEDIDVEEFVICTLDPERHYQQPLDVTVGENERVFFKVTGTHTIFLTGNYVIPVDDGPRSMYDEDDEDDEYDLSPDEDELIMGEDDESDDLDDIPDPDITEVNSDDEAIPKLVTRSKKKRPATDSDDEEGVTLDGIISKALKPEADGAKLSKKQQKKLKNNAGAAVVAASAKVETESPSGKKVSFAENLEQGPTGSKLTADKKVNGTVVDKASAKDDKAKPTAGLGMTMVKGVKIDVKKLGSGPAAKKGNKVSMRYIGKTTKDNKQFDANKKGAPFTFKLGAGEVIQGWDIGLEGICAGGERRIVIPAALAYGKKALPGIPANSELTFDVKCLEVK